MQKEAEPWALDQEAGLTQGSYGDCSWIAYKSTRKKEHFFRNGDGSFSKSYGSKSESASITSIVQQKIESVFELAVSPGVANKQFTPKQMMTLAEVVGEKGTMEYTPNHKIILKIPTTGTGSHYGKIAISRLSTFANWGCIDCKSL